MIERREIEVVMNLSKKMAQTTRHKSTTASLLLSAVATGDQKAGVTKHFNLVFEICEYSLLSYMRLLAMLMGNTKKKHF